MRANILVSQKVEKEHGTIFTEIQRIMTARFDKEVAFEIINENQLDEKTVENQTAFWEQQCRFVCFASDDEDMGYNINKAIQYWIPCVVIKGRKVKKDYLHYISELLSKEKGIKCPNNECIEGMFYEVSNQGDIKGAIAWINNFYHAIKDSIEEDIDSKYKRFFRDAGKIGQEV